jgi:hypothetical protein
MKVFFGKRGLLARSFVVAASVVLVLVGCSSEPEPSESPPATDALEKSEAMKAGDPSELGEEDEGAMPPEGAGDLGTATFNSCACVGGGNVKWCSYGTCYCQQACGVTYLPWYCGFRACTRYCTYRC